MVYAKSLIRRLLLANETNATLLVEHGLPFFMVQTVPLEGGFLGWDYHGVNETPQVRCIGLGR
jgi:hypothetical protein